ncbi:MAG: UDP-glucose 4-epimerase GalE [Bdellovibrionota bacterium]
MAKVMVIGGAGYVGSQAAKSLVKNGHEVLVFDNLSTGFRSLARFGEFVEGDMLKRPQVEACLQRFQPDAIMHFAARSLVGDSMTNPAIYYESNVRGAFEVLEAMRAQKKVPVFIFSSTCSVYGATEKPITEEQALGPINPYARTKRMIEEMLGDYAQAYAVKFCSLRYFNAAGCDPEGEVGELHDPETHLIPRLLLHTLNPAAYPTQIFGDDYPTPDGTCVRDYIHVEDLADAHIGAMNYLLKGGVNEIVNLGTTTGSSVKQVIAMAEKVTGQKLNLKVVPRRAGDPPFLVAGSSKAQKLFGWKPRHGLESIMRSAWRWTQEKRAK